jgi:MraZ protein
MQEWLAIEEKLQDAGTMDLAVRKFLDRTNYFGQLAAIDTQGRILIHPLLRSNAELTGDVQVVGYLQFLEVWSQDRFKARLDSQPYTDEDAVSIARLLRQGVM